jgi:REP element-mobilizing transposase RayT
MSQFIYKESTERNLPHFHPPGATLFVTFRLAAAIPKSVLQLYYAKKNWFQEETERIAGLKVRDDSPEMQAYTKKLREFHRHWFAKFERVLHTAETGPTWLADERAAKVVADALHYRDGKVLRLDAYCIMSNHVHAVFSPFLAERDLREIRSPLGLLFVSKNPPPNAIMKSLKGYSAWDANRVLDRKGTFWEKESYDHVVRDDQEFDRIVKYVLNNPVKAGLVKDWQQWQWSYLRNSAVS